MSVYNTDLVLCGIIDEFSSLIWHRRFFKAGYFKLFAPATANNIALLKKHCLIEKPDSDEVGYITSVKINYNSENGETITASGCFLSGLLSRRVIIDGVNGDDLLDIIDKQCGSACSDYTRVIPSLVIDKSVPVSYAYNDSMKFYNLADYCTAVCMQELCGLCVKLVHFDDKNYLLLTVRYGIDRSVNQTENPQVVFSEEFDNLLSAEYNYSDDNSVNTVYGYSTVETGVDDTPSPPEYLVGSDNCGFDRFETSAEVRAVVEAYKALQFVGYSADGNPMYAEQQRKRVRVNDTLQLLKLKCQKSCREVSENVFGDVLLDCGYKNEFDLGDVVTIFQKNWDVTLTQRIYEIAEYYDANNIFIQPMFGSPLRTIVDFVNTR